MVLCACEVPEPKEPETPAFTCETACVNLRSLKCEESEDTPEGSTCEDVCENSFQGGIKAFQWDVEQLTSTDGCEE